MSTAPVPPVVRSPQLVRGVTDASQNRSKQFIPSAYAVGKVFTGVTLKDDIDLNAYVTPGVSRVNTYKNGPPVTSPGYLVIHAVNPDEDKSAIKYRYRQIYYPDSTTETTPYTRVGNSSDGTTITWSVWTTMGGNWVCEILGGNKTGIVNYMYHSFNSWTLTLPDPKLYVTGTRIGLTQWVNNGKVVWGTNEQVTTPDISEEGTTVGALQYIFQIVPTEDGTNIWALDVDNNIAGTIEGVTNSFNSQLMALTNKHNSDVTTINNTITTTKAELQKEIDAEEAARIAADNTERNERIAADNAEKSAREQADATITSNLNPQVARLDKEKRRDMKVVDANTSVTFVYTPNGTDTNNLAKYDYLVMLGASGITITLPSNVTTKGARVVLMLRPNNTVNVVAGSTSESFTNSDASDTLVLDFQVISTSASALYTWTVLEVG